MSKLTDAKRGAPNILEFLGQFKSEKNIVDFLIPYIFPGGKVVCPYCGATDIIKRRTKYPQNYRCWHCHRCVAIFNGTMLENNKTPLKDWLYMIHSMYVSRKGRATEQIIRELNSSENKYDIHHKIQLAMANYDLKPFSNVVQMDECYVGGSNHGRFGSGYTIDNEGNAHKSTYPIFGLYEESTKRVYSCAAIPNERGQYLTGKQIKEFVDNTCLPGTMIVSDEWKSYNYLCKNGAPYLHHTVNHHEGQYVDKDGFTTNGIEGYWSLVKKTYYNTHHGIKKDWIYLYLAECDFRFNNKTWEEALDNVLKQMVFTPRVIDVRQLGKFGNRTYDLHNYRLILPAQFDNKSLEKITVDEILNCDEPVYGILREPYLSYKQRRMGRDNNKKLADAGFQKGVTGYKNYRDAITNDAAYILEMLKDATKHKEVNQVVHINAPSSHPSCSYMRNKYIQNKVNSLPAILQLQIKAEYPKVMRMSSKETLQPVYRRIRFLMHEYDRLSIAIN